MNERNQTPNFDKIYSENRIRLIQLAEKNIPSFSLTAATDIPGSAALPNAFIEIRDCDSCRYQTIASNLVLYLIDYTDTAMRHFLISPENASGIIFPTSVLQIDQIKLSQLHRHNYLELVYVISGELDFVIEGVHKRYRAGDCCFINQKVRHVESYQRAFCALYLSFRPGFFYDFPSSSQREIPDLLNFIKRNTLQNDQVDYLDFIASSSDIFYRNTFRILQCFEQIIMELVEKEPGCMDIVYGYPKRFFAILQTPGCYTCLNTRFYPEGENTLFEKTLDYVHSHKYRLTRSQIAEALHYNGNYISDVFLKHTGITLADYIRDVCLQEAASLLLNSELSVSEIIHRLGFENRTSFYQMFKKKYGVSPGEYRSSRG